MNFEYIRHLTNDFCFDAIIFLSKIPKKHYFCGFYL